MKSHPVRLTRYLIAAIVGIFIMVPANGMAATASTSTAQVAKAAKVKVCTPAQAKRKAAGKRVNCVVRPKVCKRTIAGRTVKVRCAKPGAAPRRAQLMVLRTFVDEDGPNDEPGQKDLTSTSVDTTTTSLLLTINWDITSLSGGNTADGCFLFDTDGDGKANASICVTWSSSGLQSVKKYTCSDARVDRCSGASSATTLSTSLCTLVNNATDPFGAAGNPPNLDSRASCTIPFTTAGAGAVLTNTCSYPSQEPNSDPSDCVLIPRDGFLKLQKVLVGGPAGYTGPFTLAYTCIWDGDEDDDMPTISGSESVAANSSVTIGMPDDYECSVTETPPTAPTGYAWSAGTPALPNPVNINSGQTATLTVTNTLVALPGTLTVKKTLVNDNGGTTPVTGFQFQVNGGTATAFEVDGQNDISVPAGTYSVTEVAAAGYTTTYSGCSNVVIPPGGSATCTITNNDRPATLHVKKVVTNNNGGTKGAADFSFTVNGGSDTAFEADGQNDLTVNAGTYNVTEPSVFGYAASYAGCSDIVLANGGEATCTITNDDQPATLIVNKVMDNTYGGTKTAADFSFQVNGGAATPFEADGSNSVTVNAGTYSVTENPGAQYTATFDGCTSIELGIGETATCTVTNHDKPVTITVIKNVVNDDGGTKTAGDFSVELDGGSAVGFEEDPSDPSTGTVVFTGVSAGAHTITETADGGYTTSYGAGCDIEDAVNGDSLQCTITNDDKPGALVITKVVVNDDGGTAVATDFEYSVDGDTPVAFEAGTGDTGTSGSISLPAGDHTVTEPASSAYIADNGCATVKIVNGETTECTITNDDNPGTLTVVKVVTNDDGGAKGASDFAFSVNAGGEQSFEADGENVLTVDAGTYTVVESADSAYTASYDNCEDVVVPNGGNQTCTITNDDKPGALVITKVVVNDDGGTAVATDFEYSVDGDTPVAFEAGTGDTGTSGSISLPAGDHTVTEPASSAYTADNGCATVKIVNGETTECTITNDDNPGALVITKEVVNDNGGTAVATDFSYSVDGGTPVAFSAGTGDTGTSGSISLPAGDHAVTEPATPGYVADNGCATVTIVNGETTECTIINDDQQGTLTVKKIVVNDDGGTKVETDFSFSVNGGSETAFQADGENILGVDAGTYTVVETADSAYTTTYDNCEDVVVENGGNQTCTITNDDKPGALVITKVVVNDNGGTAVATDFSYSVDGDGPVNFEAGTGDTGTSGAISLPAGEHTVGEPETPGYVADNGCATVQIVNGETTECTITNDDVAPKLALVKVVENGQNGTATPGDWTLSAAAADSDPVIERAGDVTESVAVTAGTAYILSESGPVGYDQAGPWECVNTNVEQISDNWSQDGDLIVLGVGDDVTCTVTNLVRDLEIAKTASEGPFAPGDTITYTVTVTNTGAATIPDEDIDVSDPMLGEGLVLDGEPGPLAPGESRTYTGTRPVTSRDCGEIENTATVSIPRDAVTENDSATATASVVCTSDLAISKVADSETYQPGQTITYTVVVQNVGNSIVPVEAVLVSDPTLPGLAPATELPSELAPGESIEFIGQRAVTTALCGEVVNTATVSYEGDTNAQNDSASVTVVVAGGACIQGPSPTRLRIVKDGPATAKQGKFVTYRMRVTNIGTVASVNTVVTDPLPKGLTLHSVPAGATLSGGVLRWNLGTLQPGQSKTVSVVMRSTGAVTKRKCNIGYARATNAPRVSDPACTRFVAVAAVNTPGVTG